jgi:hypothetical protein
MWRFSEDAVARAASALRARPDGLHALVGAISISQSDPPPSELDIETALLGCELSVALAGRPAPALELYPELVALVGAYVTTIGAFGSPQLGEAHARARMLRDHASAARDRAAQEGRAAEWGDDLDDLIARLHPGMSTGPRPWWQEIDDITLTLVRDRTRTELATRLGLDASAGKLRRFWEVWGGVPYDGIHLALQVDELPGQGVIIEPTGWVLTTDHIAERLSVGTSLVSVYWNTNSLMQVTVARAGQIIRRFDPLLYDQPAIGEPLPEERDLPFGKPGDCTRAAVALQERLTGVVVDAAWLLDRSRTTWYGVTAG